MIIDLDKIIKTPINDTQWEYIFKSKDAEENFLVLLLPVLEYAFIHINAYINNLNLIHLISEHLLFNGIKQNLADTLKKLIARVCVLEMHSASYHQRLLGDTTEDRFQYFIQQLKQPSNREMILKKYPLLKQKLETIVSQYLLATLEFFDRFAKDKDELYEFFLAMDPSYILSAITQSGDKHCQGRSVMILKFINKKESKRHIVYKPKSLSVDHAFQNFFAWLNQELVDFKLYRQFILLKEQYGWCEFISNHVCADENAIDRYYHRMGSLLMLTYLFAGCDLHYENIIAYGEYPVIIDYECFFTPLIAFAESNNDKPNRHLVTDMHFLPKQMNLSLTSSGVDMSAFAGQGGEISPYQTWMWAFPVSDAMHLVRTKKITEPSQNIPLLTNKSIDPMNYQNDFIDGFVQTYETILRLLPLLKTADSPLNLFKNVTVRLVFRDTSEYLKLLLEGYHPQLLIDEAASHSHFSWLANEKLPFNEAIINSEFADLYNCNIPLFNCISNGTNIFDSAGKKINLTVLKSGWQCVQYYIHRTINSEDLQLQKKLIENSFEAVSLNKVSILPMAYPIHQSFQDPQKDLECSLLKLAKAQLDTLSQFAIVNNNRIFWPTLDWAFDKKWITNFTNISLYDGVAGITLSFAYGGFIFKEKKYDEIAALGLQSLRQTLRLYGADCFHTIGAYTGVGGFLYVLLHLYYLWKDETIKDDILFILNFLQTLINDDNYFDILSGSTGCLISLMRLKGIIANKRLEPLMEQCVLHFLSAYPNPSQFDPNKESPINMMRPLLGFSHGIAGMVWALSQYDFFKVKSDVKNWIHQALFYERSQFSKTEMNWPDFRKFDPNDYSIKFKTAWCHGATGIGLARLDMQNYWQDEEINNEIDIALTTAIKKGVGSYHNLCHGSLAYLELLFAASKKNDALKPYYRNQLLNVIETIERYGLTCGMVSNEATPGLMTGIAGVAYQFMRIAYPEKVPSILLLKHP